MGVEPRAHNLGQGDDTGVKGQPGTAVSPPCNAGVLLSPLHPPPSCIAQHRAVKTWDVLGGKGLEGTQLGAAHCGAFCWI